MRRSTLSIAGIHSVGVALCAALAVGLTIAITPNAWQLVDDAQLRGAMLRSLAGQAVVGACVWPLICLVWRVLGGLKGQRKDHPVVRVSRRGSVFLETLIALPVVFLLSFGLAQFALNNIAAVMVNYATYNAARTAWIWAGEGDIHAASDRARVSAAVALTPVAYAGRQSTVLSESEAFVQARGILVAAQFSAPYKNMGADGIKQGRSLAYDAPQNPPSMAEVFGASSFKSRTARQMTAAYNATIVEVEDLGTEIQTRVRYQHFVAMPIVAGVFGRRATINGRRGQWMLFERTYTLTSMMPAHRDTRGLIGHDTVPRLL